VTVYACVISLRTFDNSPPEYIKDISCFLYIFEPKSRHFLLMNISYKVLGHFCSCFCYTVLDMQQNVPGRTFSISWRFLFHIVTRSITEPSVEKF